MIVRMIMLMIIIILIIVIVIIYNLIRIIMIIIIAASSRLFDRGAPTSCKAAANSSHCAYHASLTA